MTVLLCLVLLAPVPSTPEERAELYMKACENSRPRAELQGNVARAEDKIRTLQASKPTTPEGRRAKGDEIRQLRSWIETSKVQLKDKFAFTPELNPHKLSVGDIGAIPSRADGSRPVMMDRGDGRTVRVGMPVSLTVAVRTVSVTDATNLIAVFKLDGEDAEVFWLSGPPTDKAIDDQVLPLSGIFMVTGTKTYVDTMGANRTVPLLEPFEVDMELVREKARK